MTCGKQPKLMKQRVHQDRVDAVPGDEVATLEARGPATQVAQARGALVLRRAVGAALAAVPTQVAPACRRSRGSRIRAVVHLACGAFGCRRERGVAR